MVCHVDSGKFQFLCSLSSCPSPEHGAPAAPSTRLYRAGDLLTPQVGSWDGGYSGEAGLGQGRV